MGLTGEHKRLLKAHVASLIVRCRLILSSLPYVHSYSYGCKMGFTIYIDHWMTNVEREVLSKQSQYYNINTIIWLGLSRKRKLRFLWKRGQIDILDIPNFEMFQTSEVKLHLDQLLYFILLYSKFLTVLEPSKSDWKFSTL